MSNNEQRDELARIALDAMFPSKSDLPDDPMTWPSSTFKTAAAILAAGYRKPRTVTTAAELAALVDDTVIRDYDTCICERVGGYWNLPSDGTAYGDSEITLPATVLWAPEPTTEATK